MTNSKGVCIWFTGRSGAGKSTITSALLPLLDECGRTVSVLDVVPLLKKMSCESSSEGKLLRKAFVAGQIVKHGGIVICVTVSARREVREEARQLVGPESFVEVLVDVPADVALARKAKRTRKPPRLKRARHALRRQAARLPFRETAGYEAPLSPALTIDTMVQPAEEGAQAIFQYLLDHGFVVRPETAPVSLTGAQDGAAPSANGRLTQALAGSETG